MKEKIKKEYLRGARKLFETKLSGRNIIKGINTWARYSGPCLKRTKEEHKQMNKRTRKVMSMHSALHKRDDVARQEKREKDG